MEEEHGGYVEEGRGEVVSTLGILGRIFLTIIFFAFVAAVGHDVARSARIQQFWAGVMLATVLVFLALVATAIWVL